MVAAFNGNFIYIERKVLYPSWLLTVKFASSPKYGEPLVKGTLFRC